MRVIILPNSTQIASRAADLFCAQVARRPESVLGLATGGTPLETYRELIRRHQAGEVSFAQTTTFNLDEYVGLAADHPQSYRSFMQKHFFQHIDVDATRCHLPLANGELLESGNQYERLILDAGGIDLQLLGIGTDGHVAFNEPGSSLASRTRIKALTKQTRSDNARFFDTPEEVPKLAITMGIGSILDSRQIVLIATGTKKAQIVASFIEGPITALVPASALQLHQNVTVLLDEDASDQLQRRDYYIEVEAIQRELEK